MAISQPYATTIWHCILCEIHWRHVSFDTKMPPGRLLLTIHREQLNYLGFPMVVEHCSEINGSFVNYCSSIKFIFNCIEYENDLGKSGLGRFEFRGYYPDSKVHGANMGPTWVLSAPYGPHVGPMNLVIRVRMETDCYIVTAPGPPY